MLARRLPWVSMAARGEPAVPLVKISTARSSGSRSTAGTGVPFASDSYDPGSAKCQGTCHGECDAQVSPPT